MELRQPSRTETDPGRRQTYFPKLRTYDSIDWQRWQVAGKNCLNVAFFCVWCVLVCLLHFIRALTMYISSSIASMRIPVPV